jgi:DNA polymerase I-like protein with 3'-5' exonuclease and polymerase domains
MLNVEKLKGLLDETAQKLEVVQAQLEALLTPYIHGDRATHNEYVKQALAAWEISLATFEAATRNDWQQFEADPDWQKAVVEKWKLDPALPKDNWFDSSVDKKDGIPKGCKRFVRKRVQEWRSQNQRPVTALKSLEEPINLKSNQQLEAAVAAYLFEFGKISKTRLEPPVNFRSNTLKSVMADMPDQVNAELFGPLLAFKKAAKLLDTFGDKLLARVNEEDSRLHGNWQQIGTATGRPTCSQPNLLQMPSDAAFRQCFIAAPGYVLVIADFSQIELRIMAELSSDNAFIRAFAEGLDLHAYTASGIFNVPIEAVTDKQRRTAKIINFATLYGIGPNGLRIQLTAQGQSMSKQEARAA